MATVHKKKMPSGKLSEKYYASYRIPTSEGGTKQVKKSTGHTTKKEALAVANQLEKEALAEAGAGDIKGEAILSRVREAGELALKGRLNPAHARRLIGEIMEASGQGVLNERSCREWMEEWLKEKVATVKPGTVAFYKSTTKCFLSFLGEKADNHLETITSEDVRSYRDSIVANGRTGKTANHKLKCVRSIFGDAVKASALLQNPASSVKSVNEDDSTSREPFAPNEITQLIEAAPSPDWKGMILFGAFTGIRLGDCANLKAGNIDLKRKVVHLMPRKTDRKKKIIEVPLHPELLAFLTENPPSPFDATPLFPKLAKVTAGGRKGLSARFRAIMESAGIERNVTRRTKDGAARETAARSFHSLRHSFTSFLANANVSEEVRQKMTGHTESTTHQIYTHLELETLRNGVDKIPTLGKSQNHSNSSPLANKAQQGKPR
ncbi:tyrosine-type recombinase/integrase [Akkermansiaceae bacterium]|nr:tyrosine-type recombinase/integrase [bacterium]MDB4142955.1 tyrosine-type recombinase/integrase [Akkermansiaceae bacterium]